MYVEVGMDGMIDCLLENFRMLKIVLGCWSMKMSGRDRHGEDGPPGQGTGWSAGV